MSKLKTMNCGAAAASTVFLLSACGNDPAPTPAPVAAPVKQATEFKITHIQSSFTDSENKVVKDPFSSASKCGGNGSTVMGPELHTYTATIHGQESTIDPNDPDKRKWEPAIISQKFTLKGNEVYHGITPKDRFKSFIGDQKDNENRDIDYEERFTLTTPDGSGTISLGLPHELLAGLDTFKYHIDKSCKTHVDLAQTDFYMTGGMGKIERPDTVKEQGYCTPEEFSAHKFNYSVSGFIKYENIDAHLAYAEDDTLTLSEMLTANSSPEILLSALLAEKGLYDPQNGTSQVAPGADEILFNGITGFIADAKTQCPNFFLQLPDEAEAEGPLEEEEFEFYVEPAPNQVLEI
jgi:hypothetical protein